MNKLGLIIILSITLNGICAEIDSFTTREEVMELDDATDVINNYFNQKISQAVELANSEIEEDKEDLEGRSDFCNPENLYEALEKKIFQTTIGLKGYSLDTKLRNLLYPYTVETPLEYSMYRNVNFFQGMSLNLKGLSSVVNIGGMVIGLDKLGHFFAEGKSYFEIAYLDSDEFYNESTPEFGSAVNWGIDKESGKFGLITTGVYSHADLVANFNGMRFWNDVLKTGRDPLKSSFSNFFAEPYIGCEKHIIDTILFTGKQFFGREIEKFSDLKFVYKWKVNKKFDIRDYIDTAWDEGVNCNLYRDEDYFSNIRYSIKEILGIERDCSLAKDKCLKLKGKYGKYSKSLLNCGIHNVAE
ncbi:MAG: hypothetical protein H6622_04515 [Halobacteriovoraceae bacterium]|nr:hypothetical protein [Halobacteriovoraceae bacterium]